MKIMATYDNYGYSNMADASNCHTEREERILAASMMNYWWEEGGLENLPSGYEIVTTVARLIEIEISNCGVAFYNGSYRCQCGHKDCPRFQQELEG